MTVPFEITVCSCGDQDERLLQKIADATFNEIHLIYNKWNPRSELSLFNTSSSNEPFPISKELANLLAKADFAWRLTEKKFDPTIEPLQNRWKRAFSEASPPSNEELLEIKRSIGWEKVCLTTSAIQKTVPGLQLDLGGIAKGYGVDLLFERLLKAGFAHIYVEWGGEIRVSSRHPEGRPWKVAVKTSEGKVGKTLFLSSQALATSGDYLQNWSFPQHPDQIYFHVFNACTLSPLQMKSDTVASITIAASACWLADAVATAGMFLETEKEAEAWLTHLRKVDSSFLMEIEWRKPHD
jgi:thiamine biosynthesis lipoprotein